MQDEEVYANRRLTFTPRNGGPRVLEVRIGRPFTSPGLGGFWRLNVEIREGTDSVDEHVMGEDSAQCVDVAIDVIGDVFLERWLERGSVTWNGLHHGFGRHRREHDIDKNVRSSG
jgi:hypothetical protein